MQFDDCFVRTLVLSYYQLGMQSIGLTLPGVVIAVVNTLVVAIGMQIACLTSILHALFTKGEVGNCWLNKTTVSRFDRQQTIYYLLPFAQLNISLMDAFNVHVATVISRSVIPCCCLHGRGMSSSDKH